MKSMWFLFAGLALTYSSARGTTEADETSTSYGAHSDAGDKPHAVDAGKPQPSGTEHPDDASSSTRDGGPETKPDAGTKVLVDAGLAPKACASAGTELCENFESGTLNTQQWQIENAGNLVIDDLQVHGGKNALHVKLKPGSSTKASLTHALTFPGQSERFYLRAFVYFSPELPIRRPNSSVHQAILEVKGNAIVNELGTEGNNNQTGAAASSRLVGNFRCCGAEIVKKTREPVPVNRWICFEMLSDGSSSKSTRQVWIDDIERPELSDAQPSVPKPNWSAVSIGVRQYHAIDLLSHVWFDDIRISSRRIGCAL